jgi:hypothetical protein
MSRRIIMPAKAADAGYFCFVEVDSDLHRQSLFAERELDADARLVTYDELHEPSWLVEPLDRSVVSLCRYRYPDRERSIFVSLTDEGYVGFIGREEGFYERIPGAGMREPDATGHGKMSRIKQIGAHLYACGFGGQIYRRDAPGTWIPIDDGVRGPPTLTNTLSLEDIDGPNEEEIYVVGNDGYAAWFDGRRWRRLDTPGEDNLYALLPRPDGSVWIAGRRGRLLNGDCRAGLRDRSDPEFDAEVLSLAWFDNRLYLGTRRGLAVLDGQRISFVETGLERPIKDAHAVDAVDGALWVFGYEDIACFDGARWRHHPIAYGF